MVSDCGRVWSIRRKVLLPQNRPQGYRAVSLAGDRIPHKVHRLVLDAFVGPQPDMVTRHLNGIRDDNRLTNLAWGTTSENQLDTITHGRNPRLNKTHCKHGHELTPDNVRTGYNRNGRPTRICKACIKRNAQVSNGWKPRETAREEAADRRRSVRELYEKGVAVNEIAQQLGCTRTTVFDDLRQSGVSASRNVDRANERAERKRRLSAMKAAGLSLAEMAEREGTSKDAVRNVFKPPRPARR